MISAESLLLIGAILGLFYFWSKYHYSYWKRKGIAYIEPIPILGNTKDVLTMKTSSGLYTSVFYNDPKMINEPVVGMFTFNRPALVIREPELIKAMLIKDFNKFSNRTASVDSHVDALGGNNIFFVRNPVWREIRQKMSPVFTSGKIKQMYPLMLDIAYELEEYLEKRRNSQNSFTADVKDITSLFTTDLIATIAFGIRANSLKNPNSEFRHHTREQFNFTVSRAAAFFFVFFFPKMVGHLRIKFFGKEFSDFMRKTIGYVISERNRTGNKRNDLVDILLDMKNANELNKNSSLTKDNTFLVAQAIGFLTAGFETSSSTTAFTFYELAKHSEIQNRLREEIVEALLEGNGTIPYEKIPSLQYLGMIVDEVLRLHPVLPFLDREYKHVEGEAEFNLKPYHDYTLPDGMAVFIPIFALQRDPKYWNNPNKFDPERFSEQNKKNINPMTYMPFGSGPHNCIGSRIGLLQTKLGIVHFLKNHHLEVCEKTTPEMIYDTKALILQCAEGINLRVVYDGLYDRRANKQ